jgi:hypothetical protein
MPTKKAPSKTEREVAEKKNHPTTKTAPPAISQNGEPQPKKRQ